MAASKAFRAKYSKGVIEPLEKLDLKEGQEIMISVSSVSYGEEAKGAFERSAGGWKGLVDTDQLQRDLRKNRKIRTPEVLL